jgi:CHAD domain-containing protein
MAYRFKLQKSVRTNLQRIVGEQLERALLGLSGAPTLHEGVHNARKSLKKIRAVLRLAREPLGEAYRRENEICRDAGRRLSGLRDAAALIETVELLRQRYHGALEHEPLAELRRLLVERRNRLTENDEQLQRQVADVSTTLQTARDRVESWSIDAGGFEAIAPGLESTYRRGRKAMFLAFNEPTAEHFHEWRKRVKDHWYHVRLLRDTWPAELETRAAALEQLSELLGDDHNLAVLRELLISECGDPDQSLDRTLLLGLVDGLRIELQAQARPLGERLYAERPRGFTQRIGRYWRAARRERESCRSARALSQP